MNFETPQNIATAEKLRKQALAREHLGENIPHILVSLVDSKRNKGEDTENNKQAKDVIEQIKKEGVLINESEISQIDERDKFSPGYRNCIGFVLAGKSKHDDLDLSFMAHLHPDNWGYERNKEKLEEATNDLLKKINELILNTKEGSIDAVLFGGAAWDVKNYEKAINDLSQRLKGRLGFEPVVVTGPGGENPYTDVFFDTQKRRLYIVRSKNEDENLDNAYFASENTNKEEK